MKNVFEKPVLFGNVALRSVVSGILQESISAHPIERNSWYKKHNAVMLKNISELKPK